MKVQSKIVAVSLVDQSALYDYYYNSNPDGVITIKEGEICTVDLHSSIFLLRESEIKLNKKLAPYKKDNFKYYKAITNYEHIDIEECLKLERGKNE